MSDPFGSVADISAQLGLSQATLYRHIREGRIPAHRIGGTIRLSLRDVLAATATQTPGIFPTDASEKRRVSY